MRKQRATKKEMLERYSNFLYELMFQIERYEKVNVPSLIKRNGLKRRTIEVLVGYKVIENNGRNRWIWNKQITKISERMVERLWEKVNKIYLKESNQRKARSEERKKSKEQNLSIQPKLPLDEKPKAIEPNQFEKDLIESRKEGQPCPVKKPMPRMSISILWGVIKIN